MARRVWLFSRQLPAARTMDQRVAAKRPSEVAGLAARVDPMMGGQYTPMAEWGGPGHGAVMPRGPCRRADNA